MNGTRKKKIVILGGGVGATTAALKLSEGNWRDSYESITIYQMGWRIGGKGAAGRTPDGRILEHGLHIWLGFYENAFRIIKQAYGELAAAGIHGVYPSWQDAFTPHSYVGVDVRDASAPNGWSPFMVDFPTNSEVPGTGGELPTVASYLQMLGEVIAEVLRGGKLLKHELKLPEHPLLAWIRDSIRNEAYKVEEAVLGALSGVMLRLLAIVERADPHSALEQEAEALLASLRHVHEAMARKLASEAPSTWAIILDMSLAIMRGLIENISGIKTQGFAALDGDFCEWLGRYGASTPTCRLETNAFARGIYDFVFAFVDGDLKQPNFATGPAMRTIFRMMFTYKGAIFWKMNAGMGDTIFTPIYKVLKHRGVNIEFFSRVEDLKLSADGSALERIVIQRQATLKAGTYDPFIPSAEGIDSWPAEPNYEQLIEGQELKALGVNLESQWTPWRGVGTTTLVQGADFDTCIFGISIGSIPFVCPELIKASPKWAKMVNEVKTVRTVALQLWLKPDLSGLGWTGEAAPVIDAYEEPLNTWADLSFLSTAEGWSNWPLDQRPKSLAYLCGAAPGAISTSGNPVPEAEVLMNEIIDQFLRDYVKGIWPNATLPNSPGIDPSLILHEYRRINIDPSERYVLSLAGSTASRLAANESGFAHLVLAGDWIHNGFDAGCVEASVWSGLQAANTVMGVPLDTGIVGMYP